MHFFFCFAGGDYHYGLGVIKSGYVAPTETFYNSKHYNNRYALFAGALQKLQWQ